MEFPLPCMHGVGWLARAPAAPEKLRDPRCRILATAAARRCILPCRHILHMGIIDPVIGIRLAGPRLYRHYEGLAYWSPVGRAGAIDPSASGPDPVPDPSGRLMTAWNLPLRCFVGLGIDQPEPTALTPRRIADDRHVARSDGQSWRIARRAEVAGRHFLVVAAAGRPACPPGAGLQAPQTSASRLTQFPPMMRSIRASGQFRRCMAAVSAPVWPIDSRPAGFLIVPRSVRRRA